ncbi:hypothetical protein GCM10027429_26070 [Marivirga atlantica]|jgi:hypothetical protein
MDNSPFDAFQWKNRILVIYSNESSNSLTSQKQYYADGKTDYEERDLIVFVLTDKTLNYIDNSAASIDAIDVRNFLNISEKDTFNVSLIGKDGGIKLQQNTLLTNEKLFATIDAMPMRKREMRKD